MDRIDREEAGWLVALSWLSALEETARDFHGTRPKVFSERAYEHAVQYYLHLLADEYGFPVPKSDSIRKAVEDYIQIGIAGGLFRDANHFELAEVNPTFERMAKERGFFSKELMMKIAKVGHLASLSEVPEDIKKVFRTSHEIAPEWHIRMQAAFQDHVDNAVSKTVNFANAARPEDVEHVYLLAYELGVKGVTIYRDGSRQEQVLNIGEVNRKASDNGHSVQMQLGPQGQPIMPVRPSRSPVLRGETREKVTGCGSLYVTVNEDDFGPREIFANMGKAGGCASASTEAIGRLISLAFRYGVPPDKIVKQLRGIRCHVPLGFGPNQILSCPDAIGKALADKYHLASGNGSKAVGQLEMPIAYAQGACPDCGGAVEHEGGCMVCRACGYSKCA